MQIVLLSGLSALVMSLLCTPLARKLAIKFEIMASPNHRTVPNGATPKFGGLGFYLGVVKGLIIFAIVYEDASYN